MISPRGVRHTRPPMRRHLPHTRSRGRRVPAWVVPLLLGAVCFVVYNANLRTIGSGDTLPTRYLPLVLWHDHTLDLDASARLIAHGHPAKAPPKQTALL